MRCRSDHAEFGRQLLEVAHGCDGAVCGSQRISVDRIRGGRNDIIDRERPATIPKAIHVLSDSRDSRTHGEHLHIPEIEFRMQTEILIGHIPTANYRGAAIDNQHFVMHPMVGARKLAETKKLAQNHSVGTVAKRIVNSRFDVHVII